MSIKTELYNANRLLYVSFIISEKEFSDNQSKIDNLTEGNLK